MAEANLKQKELAVEIVRLRELQSKLKEDIAKYKRLTNPENLPGKDVLSDKDKDDLLQNFNFRLQRNSWILKKIVHQIRQIA